MSAASPSEHLRRSRKSLTVFGDAQSYWFFCFERCKGQSTFPTDYFDMRPGVSIDYPEQMIWKRGKFIEHFGEAAAADFFRPILTDSDIEQFYIRKPSKEEDQLGLINVAPGVSGLAKYEKLIDYLIKAKQEIDQLVSTSGTSQVSSESPAGSPAHATMPGMGSPRFGFTALASPSPGRFLKLRAPAPAFEEFPLKIVCPRFVPVPLSGPTQAPASPVGSTAPLPPSIEVPKNISTRVCKFGVDSSGSYAIDNVVVLLPHKSANESAVYYICGLMNCNVTEMFVRKNLPIENDRYHFDPMFVAACPLIFTMNPVHWEYFVGLSRAMEELKRQLQKMEDNLAAIEPVGYREFVKEFGHLASMLSTPEDDADLHRALRWLHEETRTHVVETVHRVSVVQFLINDFAYSLYGLSLEDQEMIENDLRLHPSTHVRDLLHRKLLHRMEGTSTTVGNGILPPEIPEWVPALSAPRSEAAANAAGIPGSPLGREKMVIPPRRVSLSENIETILSK